MKCSHSISLEIQDPSLTPKLESTPYCFYITSNIGGPHLADPAVEADLFCAKLLGYTHRNGKDPTVQVLRSFVDHLPLVTHLKTAVLV